MVRGTEADATGAGVALKRQTWESDESHRGPFASSRMAVVQGGTYLGIATTAHRRKRCDLLRLGRVDPPPPALGTCGTLGSPGQPGVVPRWSQGIQGIQVPLSAAVGCVQPARPSKKGECPRALEWNKRTPPLCPSTYSSYSSACVYVSVR